MYQYINIKTDEVVEDFMAEEYVLDKLGITVTPKGKNGEMTLEQVENIEQTVEWYFSGNWVKEKVEDDDIPDLEAELEKADRIYQDTLDRKWGLE